MVIGGDKVAYLWAGVVYWWGFSGSWVSMWWFIGGLLASCGCLLVGMWKLISELW